MALPIRLSMSAFLAARLADSLALRRPTSSRAKKLAAAETAKDKKETAPALVKQFKVFHTL